MVTISWVKHLLCGFSALISYLLTCPYLKRLAGASFEFLYRSHPISVGCRSERKASGGIWRYKRICVFPCGWDKLLFMFQRRLTDIMFLCLCFGWGPAWQRPLDTCWDSQSCCMTVPPFPRMPKTGTWRRLSWDHAIWARKVTFEYIYLNWYSSFACRNATAN